MVTTKFLVGTQARLETIINDQMVNVPCSVYVTENGWFYLGTTQEWSDYFTGRRPDMPANEDEDIPDGGEPSWLLIEPGCKNENTNCD